MTNSQKIILTIDQGTTSTRAFLYSFNERKVIGLSQKEFQQFYPQPSWVEHDLNEIWDTVLFTCQNVVQKAGIEFKDISGIGITNQRETIGIWEKKTGQPLTQAIVWQDKRTSEFCQDLKKQGWAKKITHKTGLTIDPYFSSSKIHWLINRNKDFKKKATNQEICIGTIDSFLIWKLTQGENFYTDITNACRTNLYNIHSLKWDDELLDLFSVPLEGLPEVLPCNSFFGEAKVFKHPLPIFGVAGDQQASLFGHGGFSNGALKITYGTGAFLLINTGQQVIHSQNQLLSTIGYQLTNEKPYYALEGSIFVAGSALKWLKEKVNLIEEYKQVEGFAQSLASNQGVYFVPSFTGLGTPYWNPRARGAILGMTLDTDKKVISRAILESLAYQTYDIIRTLSLDGIKPPYLKVDGGVSVNDWFLNFMANLLGLDIIRSKQVETTAIGATFLAALGCGLLKDLKEVENYISTDKTFKDEKTLNKEQLLRGWKMAIESVEKFSSGQ